MVPGREGSAEDTPAPEGGPQRRTWAHKNVAGQKGDWKVEIKDAEGKF